MREKCVNIFRIIITSIYIGLYPFPELIFGSVDLLTKILLPTYKVSIIQDIYGWRVAPPSTSKAYPRGLMEVFPVGPSEKS